MDGAAYRVYIASIIWMELHMDAFVWMPSYGWSCIYIYIYIALQAYIVYIRIAQFAKNESTVGQGYLQNEEDL